MSNFTVEAAYAAPSPSLARLAVDNALERANLSASTAAAGHPISNVITRDTYQTWRPTAVSAVVSADFTATETVNYLLIGRHDMGSKGITATVEVDTDGAPFVLVATLTPDHDGPILIPFADFDASDVRITFGAQAIPTIGLIMAGNAVTMPVGVRGAMSPVFLSRQTTVTPQTSEGGQALGSVVVRTGVEVAPEWRNLSSDFYTSKLKPLAQSLPGLLIGFAWQPEKAPDEAVLGVVTGDPRGQHMPGLPRYTFGFTIRGVAVQ